MRSSSILLSLALLLCIGSISAESLLTGTWSNPYTSKNVSRYCCIPTSIEVQSSGSGFTAYYKYPSSLNSNCWNLFLSSSSGDMKLYSTGSSYNTESAYSETTFFGNMVFDFYASNTTGTPNLHVYSDSSAYSDQCDFTMYTRVGKRIFLGDFFCNFSRWEITTESERLEGKIRIFNREIFAILNFFFNVENEETIT